MSSGARTASSPPFTAAHEALRARMRGWIASELRPHAPSWERAGSFPDSVFGALAAQGWLGLKYGPAADWVADAVLCEELARCGSGGVAAGIGAHVGIATPPIARFGTEWQRERWLVPAIRGEAIGALAITEPDAGSDVASLRTRAVPVDGGWLVSGAKTFITNGVRASFYLTAVRTGGAGHGGISFLVIERGDGVRASPLRKLGWRASDTAELAFDEVFVPAEHLLGELDRGFALIMANFQWERLLMALGAVGAMRRGVEEAVAGLPSRPGGYGGAARAAVAELAVRAETGAALTYHALRRFLDWREAGEAAGDEAFGRGSAVREVTMAKLLTQRASFEVAESVLALLGPDDAGERERAVRDARLGPIGGGTDEIMREILGRMLVG
ncbi:MAG TPA: acyl-CoA dehydrogenase family protein [Solirubrobacteraceae bacterium]|nr:acyl-CoA dehydrogenase family protein [Solirubrobacteraceae bacterium]